MENTATAPADRVLSYFDVDTYGENADPAMRALQTPRLREIRTEGSIELARRLRNERP